MSIFKSDTDHTDHTADRTDVAPDEQLAQPDHDSHSRHEAGERDVFGEPTDAPASTGDDRDRTGTGEHRDDPHAAPAPDHDPAAATAANPAERAASHAGDGEPERLVTQERADEYSARWESAKSMFVDEPRQAVGQADALVGELLDELQEAFGNQRRKLEDGLDADTTSTEDLRMALRRYRSFFDRLVSF